MEMKLKQAARNTGTTEHWWTLRSQEWMTTTTSPTFPSREEAVQNALDYAASVTQSAELMAVRSRAGTAPDPQEARAILERLQTATEDLADNVKDPYTGDPQYWRDIAELAGSIHRIARQAALNLDPGFDGPNG